MRLLVIAALVVVVAATAFARSGATGQPADRVAAERLLIDRERRLNESLTKQDRGAFLALTASDGVWASTGSFVPAGALAGVLNQIEITQWDLVNPNVVWVDTGTAVVSYVWAGTARFFGRPVAPKRVASTVWTKRGGEWVAVFHQESDAHTKE